MYPAGHWWVGSALLGSGSYLMHQNRVAEAFDAVILEFGMAGMRGRRFIRTS